MPHQAEKPVLTRPQSRLGCSDILAELCIGRIVNRQRPKALQCGPVSIASLFAIPRFFQQGCQVKNTLGDQAPIIGIQRLQSQQLSFHPQPGLAQPQGFGSAGFLFPQQPRRPIHRNALCP
jgi:hypothetical protein